MSAIALPELPAQFVAATLNYGALLPLLIVFGFALIGVLVEAFVPKETRYAVQVAITLIGLIGAFLAVVFVAVNHQTSTAGLSSGTGVKGSVVIDGPALFLQGAVIVLSFMGTPPEHAQSPRRSVAASIPPSDNRGRLVPCVHCAAAASESLPP